PMNAAVPRHKARAPVPDENEITPTCRQTAATSQKSSDPKKGPPNRCVGGLYAINPRRAAAPGRVDRGSGNSEIPHRESEGTPTGNQVAPTALVHGHRLRRFLMRRSLWQQSRPLRMHCEVRAPVADVRV